MKRIIAILLMLIYFSGTVPLVSAEELQTEETVDIEAQDALMTDDKIEAVFSLGIMKKNSDDNMFLEGGVSRMDFVEWIFRIMNFERKDDSIESSEQYFEDISIYHYGAGYIQDLVLKGIIGGYEDKTFKPEKKITYEEASAIAVRAIGHEMYANATGKSHYAYAKDIGIRDGLSIGLNDEFRRCDAAHMLYNMMFIKVPSIVFSNQAVSSRGKGEEFIRGVMGIDYVDGIIDAIGGVSLYDKQAPEDIVSIDGVTYNTKCDFDDAHLGYKSRAYIDPDNYDSLICYTVNKTNVEELWSYDITDYSNNTYKYISETGKEKKATIEEDFDFVYNKYYSQDITKIIPKYGKVKLIDNNRNGRYDVVIVTDMQSLVVDKIIGENEIIFKNKDSENKNIAINLKDYDNISIYNSEGYEAKQSTIRAGVVLTIIKNDNGVIDIYVSDKTVSGRVTVSGRDDNKRYVEIDENKYELFDDCYCDSWNGDVGIEVVLRFDRYDKVASVECSYASGWQYGYIMKIAKTDDGFGERVLFKMLTESGAVEELALREKAIINATTVRTGDEQYHMLMAAYNDFETESKEEGVTAHKKELATTHLVKYQTNAEGIITKIDTPVRRSIFATDGINSDADDSFMLRCKGNMYYEPRQKQFRAAYKSYIDLSGEIFVDGKTKIFVIPDEENTNPKDDDYRVSTMQGVGFNPNGQFVYASGYNSDNNSLVCDAVVLRFGTGATTDSNLMIFKEGMQALDDNNEIRTLISGYANGNIVEYYMSEREQSVDISELKRGDIILYRLANGEMKVESVIYNKSETGILNNSSAYAPYSSETYFNASFRVVKGIPVKTSDGCIYIDFDDEDMLDEILKISAIGVFEETGGRQFFYTVTPENIKTRQTHGKNADTIFLCTKNGQNISAVIVRK